MRAPFAWAVYRRDVDHARTYFFGDGEPELDDASWVDLLRWMTEEVRPFARVKDRGLFATALGAFEKTAAERVALMKRIEAATPDWVAMRIVWGGAALPTDAPAIFVAHRALRATLPPSKRAPMSEVATEAAEAAVNVFRQRKAERAFIARFEKRLLLAEVREGLRGNPDADRVKRVVWRWQPGRRLAYEWWLVELRDGRWGALNCKRRRKPRWYAGTKDDVLATIPDGLFARAVKAASG